MDIHHTKLPGYLKGLKPGEFAPVYLLFGDEMLVKQAFGLLLDAMVPKDQQSLNYEPLYGSDDPVGAVLEAMDTYPMFPATKVVAWHDTRVFTSRQDTAKLVARAREAWEEEDAKKAANSILAFLSIHGLSLDDISGSDPGAAVASAAGIDNPGDWVADVIDHCRENNMAVPAGADEAQALADAVERGFPEGNHLVLTADLVDRRKKLYKLVADKGVVIECAVPQGERKADRDAQQEVLAGTRDKVLRDRGKTMDQPAFRALVERTGADVRSFVTNLEKLALYAGDREKITVADVEKMIGRTREDPIFELTNAVFDKDAGAALVLVRRLLDNNLYPLQILAALANQTRRMLAARMFLDGPDGRVFTQGTPYPRFSSAVMPLVKRHDEALLARVVEWEGGREEAETGGKKGRGKKAKKPTTDLLLAGSSKSPYPVYQTLLRASRFTTGELTALVQSLVEADRRLKRSGTDAAVTLERVILAACRKTA
ncbi:MAG: DNA polymerase III subunit delta [Desulfatibacillaceae bacterium]